MIKIHEPDVTLTDYLLTLECIILVLYMGPHYILADPVRLWLGTGLAATGLAAASGGTAHGFYPKPDGYMHQLLWRLTLVSLGITAMSLWALGAVLILNIDTALVVRDIALIIVGIYMLYALTHRQHFPNFLLAMLFYLPAALFAFIAYVLVWWRTGDSQILWGAGGMAMTLGAAIIQKKKIRLHRHFDHNALYHIIQGAGLILLLIGTIPLFKTP